MGLMNKVYCCVGLPSSGKSTFVERIIKQHDFVVIHPDAIRKELTGSVEDQSKNAEVFKLAFSRMDAALAAGKDVIFDSCAQSRERRKPIVKIAKQHGALVVAVVFDVGLKVAKERNSKRDRVVPEFVLDRMNSQWEAPSENEGFDEIAYQF